MTRHSLHLQQLYDWAEAQPEHSVLGWTDNPECCPIARGACHVLGLEPGTVHVELDEVYVYDTKTHLAEDVDYDFPPGQLYDRVDDLSEDPGTPVTREQFLGILEQALAEAAR